MREPRPTSYELLYNLRPLPPRPLRPLREALSYRVLGLALFDRDEGPGLGADVISIRANQFVIRSLLLDVG